MSIQYGKSRKGWRAYDTVHGLEAFGATRSEASQKLKSLIAIKEGKKKPKLCSSCGSECWGENEYEIRKHEGRNRKVYWLCRCCFYDIARDFNISLLPKG